MAALSIHCTLLACTPLLRHLTSTARVARRQTYFPGCVQEVDSASRPCDQTLSHLSRHHLLQCPSVRPQRPPAQYAWACLAWREDRLSPRPPPPHSPEGLAIYYVQMETVDCDCDRACDFDFHFNTPFPPSFPLQKDLFANVLSIC